MTLEEWKYYRNITVRAMEVLNKNVLSKRLGIDMNLARDIGNGIYDWQTKRWERIVKEIDKSHIRHSYIPTKANKSK